ncbi:GlxA family transcriptional regulator [Luteibacter anthropi]|uniref:GlxA family transcriptional regulator n=1 Tax=Luteibacter anthropi TaxID=564369 RepID=UPI002032B65E|nr:GlxA family transcriptional regulator [Luteibacter anthropi]URX61450.1 GlxA family transcriptional regulator [Luteibacter anthropi]
MNRIAFFVSPGFWLLDLAGPMGAFEAASAVAEQPLYELAITSAEGGAVTSSAGVSLPTMAHGSFYADTVVFVGGQIEPMIAPEVVNAAKAHAAHASRVASVCTGAFLLAETGLLDGRRATTHWKKALQFQQRYPSVRTEVDAIFVSDGPIWSSAGVTAGIDLALALIEADQGPEIARLVSQSLVVYHRRSGGQSQFSEMSQMEPASDRIRRALTFAREHLNQPLPIERLAEAANLSVRQFGRAFRQETGETPAKAVERLRVEAARSRLRDGAEPVERIAAAVGFHDPERMRRAFVKIHGMSPQAMRRVAKGMPEEQHA